MGYRTLVICVALPLWQAGPATVRGQEEKPATLQGKTPTPTDLGVPPLPAVGTQVGKPDPLREQWYTPLSVVAYPLVTYGLSPGFEAFPLYPDDASALKHFPEFLLKELQADDPTRRIHAYDYLAKFAYFTRTAPWKLDRDEAPDLISVAVGPYADRIRLALEQAVRDRGGNGRPLAAAVLLTFVPDHQRGLDVLLAELHAAEPDRQTSACETIGELRLSHPRLVTGLAAALRADKAEVRQAAAKAAWEIGPRAAATVPGLVELLKDGPAAYAEVHPFGAIAFPQTHNLALLALAEMGDKARPAVPVIADRLPPAAMKKKPRQPQPGFVAWLREVEEEEWLLLLDCLAKLGPVAQEALPALRRQMAGADKAARLQAAATVLCIDPVDAAAKAALLAALQGADGKQRAAAVEACGRFGPKVPAFVSPLAAALGHPEEKVRFRAAFALGEMGVIAGPAVPALEQMLNNEKFDFHSHRAAAHALGRIGKLALPVLVRVARTPLAPGRHWATDALGQLKGEAAQVIPVLVELLKEEGCGCDAAVALGRLRVRTPQVEEALTRAAASESEVCLYAAWALTQVRRGQGP